MVEADPRFRPLDQEQTIQHMTDSERMLESLRDIANDLWWSWNEIAASIETGIDTGIDSGSFHSEP